MVETSVSSFYVRAHRSGMGDHRFHSLEGAIEDLPRDLELLQESIDQRLEAPQTRPLSEHSGGGKLPAAPMHVRAPTDLQVAVGCAHRVERLLLAGGRPGRHPAAISIPTATTAAFALHCIGATTAGARLHRHLLLKLDRVVEPQVEHFVGRSRRGVDVKERIWLRRCRIVDVFELLAGNHRRILL